MPYDRERAMRRNADFITDPHKTGVLIRVTSFGPIELPESDPLEAFDLPREINRYCDQAIERYLRFREAHDRFDDDWIPALKPYLGIAEHSCFLGGEVTYGGNTIAGQTYNFFMPLIAVALIYLALVMFLTWVVGKVERRLRSSDN